MKSGTTGANRFLDEAFGVWMSSIKHKCVRCTLSDHNKEK